MRITAPRTRPDTRPTRLRGVAVTASLMNERPFDHLNGAAHAPSAHWVLASKRDAVLIRVEPASCAKPTAPASRRKSRRV